MSLEKVKAMASMLFLICKLYIEEAYLRMSIDKYSSSTDRIQEYNTSLNIALSQSLETTNVTTKCVPVLKPAFDYIKNNFKQKISIDKVASICNISPSYFSRLFQKENLGTFTDYLNKLKIEHAKRLLKATDMSIVDISNDVGFSDPAYFIKIFKKNENITPTVYRKS